MIGKQTRRRIVIAAEMAIAFAASATDLRAVVLLRDGFEAANGDVVNASPNIGGSDVGQSWLITNEGQGFIRVADENAGVAPRPGSGDQFLHLVRPITEQNSSDGLATLTNSVSAGVLQVSFSIYNTVPDGDSLGSQLVLGATPGNAIPPALQCINLVFVPDGSVRQSVSPLFDFVEVLPPDSYPREVWTDVLLTIDIDSRSFDLAIGPSNVSSLLFSPIENSTISHAAFNPAHNSVSFVDDVEILLVPEPPTFPLILLGMMCIAIIGKIRI